MTILDPFGEEEETIDFPYKSFNFVSMFVIERKQRLWDKARWMIICVDDSSKAIDAIPHISPATNNIDFCE